MLGVGFDIHRLVRGRPLILGGVKINYSKGLLGHSDGDVLLHAICDALLGAISRGDIGDHFPDTDQRWRGRESSHFIKEILKMVARQKKKVAHIDTIIFAQEPRLTKVKSKIRQSLAQLLHTSRKHVNVKAKTLEKLGPLGEGRALAALALALVIPLKILPRRH